MRVKTFKFKKYINDKGFYGDITLGVEVLGANEPLEISYDSLSVAPEWFFAIEFGVKYFYEHYYKDHGKSIKVEVRRLHTMTVDSSYMVIFYVTVNCLSEMLLSSRELVSLNVDGTFSVCK